MKGKKRLEELIKSQQEFVLNKNHNKRLLKNEIRYFFCFY